MSYWDWGKMFSNMKSKILRNNFFVFKNEFKKPLFPKLALFCNSYQ